MIAGRDRSTRDAVLQMLQTTVASTWRRCNLARAGCRFSPVPGTSKTVVRDRRSHRILNTCIEFFAPSYLKQAIAILVKMGTATVPRSHADAEVAGRLGKSSRPYCRFKNTGRDCRHAHERLKPAFLTTWRGEVCERPVSTRRAPLGARRRTFAGAAWPTRILVLPQQAATSVQRPTGKVR